MGVLPAKTGIDPLLTTTTGSFWGIRNSIQSSCHLAAAIMRKRDHFSVAGCTINSFTISERGSTRLRPSVDTGEDIVRTGFRVCVSA